MRRLLLLVALSLLGARQAAAQQVRGTVRDAATTDFDFGLRTRKK